MQYSKFIFVGICLFWVSCKTPPKFDPEMLTGSWNGIDWKVDGKSSGRDAGSVNFVFVTQVMNRSESQGTYIAAYGDQKEKGSFRLENDKLYTTAEDKVEKVVRILHLSADTLILGMNRMGQSEELVLVERH